MRNDKTFNIKYFYTMRNGQTENIDTFLLLKAFETIGIETSDIQIFLLKQESL